LLCRNKGVEGSRVHLSGGRGCLGAADDAAINGTLEHLCAHFQTCCELFALDRGEKQDRIDSTLRSVEATFRALSKFSGSFSRDRPIGQEAAVLQAKMAEIDV
jgi:hypothetical protein